MRWITELYFDNHYMYLDLATLPYLSYVIAFNHQMTEIDYLWMGLCGIEPFFLD